MLTNSRQFSAQSGTIFIKKNLAGDATHLNTTGCKFLLLENGAIAYGNLLEKNRFFTKYESISCLGRYARQVIIRFFVYFVSITSVQGTHLAVLYGDSLTFLTWLNQIDAIDLLLID